MIVRLAVWGYVIVFKEKAGYRIIWCLVFRGVINSARNVPLVTVQHVLGVVTYIGEGNGLALCQLILQRSVPLLGVRRFPWPLEPNEVQTFRIKVRACRIRICG